MEQNIERILSTVERIEKKLDTCVQEIKALKERVNNIESDNKQLTSVTKKLEEQIDRLENQARRNNIIIYGMQEKDTENWNETEEIVIKFVKEKLQIGLEEFQIERAHRLGYAKNKKRPIIAKLYNFKIKEEIIKNGKLLKGTGFAVSEDFSRKVKDERSKLKPLLNTAKEQGRKAVLRYNKISIDGQKLDYDKAYNLLQTNKQQETVTVAASLRDVEPVDFKSTSRETTEKNVAAAVAAAGTSASDRPRRKLNSK